MSDERMDHPPTPAAGANEPRESVGTQLARRRQELGLSVEAVASRLNLAPRQVDAIETDNLAALPGLASTRGFVRAYAKLLRMDATPLVAALSQEAGPLEASIPLRRPLPATPFAPVRLAPMHGKRSAKRLWGLVTLVVIVLGAVAAWQTGLFGSAGEGMNLHLTRGISASAPASAPAVTAPGSSSTQGMSSTPLPAPVLPPSQSAPAASNAAQPDAAAPAGTSPNPLATSSAPAAAPTPATGTPAALVASAPTSGTPAANPAAAHAASSPAAANTATPPSASAPSPAAGPAQAGEGRSLVLNAKESSWVEVRSNNKVLLSRTLSAGSSEKIDLPGPAVLVVGNVRGVQAELGGQPLALRSQARNNVARLELK